MWQGKRNNRTPILSLIYLETLVIFQSKHSLQSFGGIFAAYDKQRKWVSLGLTHAEGYNFCLWIFSYKYHLGLYEMFICIQLSLKYNNIEMIFIDSKKQQSWGFQKWMYRGCWKISMEKSIGYNLILVEFYHFWSTTFREIQSFKIDGEIIYLQ